MNEIIDGSDLAQRLGLTWRYQVVCGEFDRPYIDVDRAGQSHTIILPHNTSDELNQISLAEMMVRAKLVEEIDPLMANVVYDPTLDTKNPKVEKQMVLLAYAQQWTELWVIDEIASRLSPSEARANMITTTYLANLLSVDSLSKLNPIELCLMYVINIASVQRLKLEIDKDLFTENQEFGEKLVTLFGRSSVDQLVALAQQFATEIPKIDEINGNILKEYELITQAMIPVIGGQFSAHLIDFEGRKVWTLEE